MKIYRYHRIGAPFTSLYVVAASVWEALEYLRSKNIPDVTGIEELGSVEIVPKAEKEGA